MLLRPSNLCRKVVEIGLRLDWGEQRVNDSPRRLHPQEFRVTPGAHEVERIDNPFVPGGEPWLVLKGSRIGAAESYLRRLAAVVPVSEFTLHHSVFFHFRWKKAVRQHSSIKLRTAGCHCVPHGH